MMIEAGTEGHAQLPSGGSGTAEPLGTSLSAEAQENAPGLSAEPEVRKNLARLEAGDQHLTDHAVSAEHCQLRADELFARIAWARIAEPGDGVAGELLAAFGSRAALGTLIRREPLQQIQAQLSAAGREVEIAALRAAMRRWYPRLDRAETVRDIERAVEASLSVVVPEDPLWPHALDDLGSHRPILLWVRGDLSCLGESSLSVVGARAATGYGTHITAEIVDGVCSSGVSIVSGAAYGIDAVAHRTALAASAPTIAVLAGGADRPYPAAHDALLDCIAENGAVCAEMIPGAAPTRWRFLQRNRIIAALSAATLVTEAGVRSGTLNTAGHAASLGRVIGAVPGPVTSAASAGCHRLIRDYGATLVTNAREACELLGSSVGLDLNDDAAGDRESSRHQRVLDAMPLRGTRDAGEIARLAGLGERETRGVLAELELLERVRQEDSPNTSAREWRLLRRE